MRINLKLLLIFLEITLIPLLILGFVVYSSAKGEITSQITSKLEAVADIQKTRFENANKVNLEKLMLLIHDPDLLQETDKYNKTLNVQSQGKIQNILADKLKGSASFIEISIANLNGDVIYSTNPKSIGLNLSQYEYYQKGKNESSVTNFSKSQNGAISLYSAGPLISDNKTIGVLVINSDGSDITTIVGSYIGLGQTGETLLVSKDANGDVLFLTPVRFDPNASLTRIVPKDRTRIPSTHAVNGEEIIMLEAVDYNNIPVIAVTRYIPKADWGIVAKISRKEAYGAINNLRNLLIFMVIVSTAIIIGISLSISKSLTDPIKKLAQFADEISHKNFDTTTTTTTGINSNDEIGMLARSFSTMSVKLKEYYGELAQKVEERTQQLDEKVKSLEDSKRASMNLLEDLKSSKEQSEILTKDLEKFKLALDNTSDMVVIADPEGVVLYGNKAVEEVTGYKAEEAIGKKSGTLWKSPMPQEFYQTLWDTISNQKKTFSSEIQNKRKNGELYTSQISISPVLNKDGKVIFFVGIEHDITREKEIDKAKTEFVSLASHQLRTPLSTINWYLEMLMSDDKAKLNDTQNEYAEEAALASKRMVGLVDSLLNVSRIEMGTFTITPEIISIADIIKVVIKELEHKILEKKLEVTPEYDPSVPKVMVDPKLLSIVFQNLLENAVNYTSEEGKIEVSLKKRENDILITVEDTGIGIPENQKSKIFTKLFRADNAREREANGNGLGLYMTKAIVENSGGRIWFESPVPNRGGTAFYIAIPVSGMKAKEGTKQLD